MINKKSFLDFTQNVAGLGLGGGFPDETDSAVLSPGIKYLRYRRTASSSCRGFFVFIEHVLVLRFKIRTAV